MLSPRQGPNIDLACQKVPWRALAAITLTVCLPSWQMCSMEWLLGTSYLLPASDGEQSEVGSIGGRFIQSIVASIRLAMRWFPLSGDGWPQLSPWDQRHF